jgi:hypothetical protein
MIKKIDFIKQMAIIKLGIGSGTGGENFLS